MLETSKSINNISIRLTDERWSHITEEHAELAGLKYQVLEAVASLDFIIRGEAGELIAIQEMKIGRHLVVVYKGLTNDGFIITAFITKRAEKLKNREIIWQLKN